MEHLTFSNAALTIALGLASGIFAQSVAHHLRIPGIVLLLITGVFLDRMSAALFNPKHWAPPLVSSLGLLLNKTR